MTLTLDEVRQTRFHIARRSGYEVTDVDNFVDKVEATMLSLTDENETLRKQLSSVNDTENTDLVKENERLRRELSQLRSAGPAAAPAAGNNAELEQLRRQNEELTRRLREAEANAQRGAAAQPAGERIVVETSAEASPAVVRLVELATQQAEQVVAEAEAEAKQKVDAANREAHEITVDARTKADRVESEARVNAERVTSEAQRKADDLTTEVASRRRELFSQLEAERDELTGRVHELRSFETSFRSNLTDHLKGQISALEKGVFEPDQKPGLLHTKPADGERGESSTPRLDALLGDRD